MLPFLVEQSFTIVGAVASLVILIQRPSDNQVSNVDELYTTDLTEKDDLLSGDNKTILIIAVIIAIAIIMHSWLVIFTLYQQYAYLRLITMMGPFALAANHMHRNVAVIENGHYQPSYGRSTIVGLQ